MKMLASELNQAVIDNLRVNINTNDWCLNCILEESSKPVFEPQRTLHSFEPNKGWRFYLNAMRKRHIGHVQSSRSRLRAMFNYIEYNGQIQVLRFCLFEATKDDRIWALKIILYHPELIQYGSASKQAQWRKEILEV